MGAYHPCALEGASPVELVVALYDGIIRFLNLAAEAVDRADVNARRVAVKRALDIIIHLQAHLRIDISDSPAETLSEFYASTFAQILQASQSASRPKFEHAIHCVRNVREAWKKVAQDCAGGLFESPMDARSQPDHAEKAISDRQLCSDARWTA
jgi:flagellar secretion chaperone FliS